MTNKTISINPSLFSVNSSKTKKKTEKTPKKNITPIISPNVLKNRLLKRIKEHKQKETQNLLIDKNKIKNSTTNESNTTLKSNSNRETENFNDEFMDSINYLQTLSKQKNIENENKINMLNNQRRKEEIERKTVKNYFSMNQQPIVNIDLPEELVQPILQITQPEPISINPYTGNDLPYGILKGGKKPTYKEWSRTVRNNVVTNPNAALTIHGPNMSSEILARENRLNLLKQKIKSKNEETIVDPFLTENLIKKNVDINDNIDEHSFDNLSSEQPQNEVKIDSNSIDNISNINTNNIDGTLIGTKHITKKTIKRKYTLGRSQIKKTVSVLIKDNKTRKTILMAQKELKRKNINDIKIYLKEHNLIKTGSNAPNDVLRKIYESSMLTGEITNSNVDTLLHNFSKEEKKL